MSCVHLAEIPLAPHSRFLSYVGKMAGSWRLKSFLEYIHSFRSMPSIDILAWTPESNWLHKASFRGFKKQSIFPSPTIPILQPQASGPSRYVCSLPLSVSHSGLDRSELWFQESSQSGPSVVSFSMDLGGRIEVKLRDKLTKSNSSLIWIASPGILILNIMLILPLLISVTNGLDSSLVNGMGFYDYSPWNLLKG